jgi:hypothetical protein
MTTSVGGHCVPLSTLIDLPELIILVTKSMDLSVSGCSIALAARLQQYLPALAAFAAIPACLLE